MTRLLQQAASGKSGKAAPNVMWCNMGNPMNLATRTNNESIVARVEALGGGYLWDAEIFAITLMGVAVDDADARILVGLVGVQHIALDGSQVSLETLKEIASIAGLQSLVLCKPVLSHAELASLQAVGPTVDVVVE